MKKQEKRSFGDWFFNFLSEPGSIETLIVIICLLVFLIGGLIALMIYSSYFIFIIIPTVSYGLYYLFKKKRA